MVDKEQKSGKNTACLPPTWPPLILVFLNKLSRQLQIGLRASGKAVVGGDGLAIAGSLGQADVPGNDRGEDLA